MRSCRDCAYAHWNENRCMIPLIGSWTASLICANWAESPGHLREVTSAEPCANFRPRRNKPVWTEVPAPADDEVRYIPLTKGLFATVDAADYEALSQYKWTALVTGEKVYAIRNEKGKTILMHRQIMNPPKGLVVDHIDGSGVNNRRANLRTCTRQQNLCNTRPRGGRSKYKGVRYDKRRKKWIAEITYKGKKHYLGAFDNEIEAAQAYDAEAVELFGPYARLNFPAHDPSS
ncbi:MAG: HNH endonuclease [Phycisphaerales bacterium]|nr:MAG: HNH endonuclease [Phycisphaerales bacterium]